MALEQRFLLNATADAAVEAASGRYHIERRRLPA